MWNEMQLRELFEEYGPVYQLNILRDKNTNQSKGKQNDYRQREEQK